MDHLTFVANRRASAASAGIIAVLALLDRRVRLMHRYREPRCRPLLAFVFSRFARRNS